MQRFLWDTKFSRVNTLRFSAPLFILSVKEPISVYLLPVLFLSFSLRRIGCVFSSHKVAAITIWYLSVFRTLLRPRLGIYIDNWVMWSVNRANITFPWHKYIWGNGFGISFTQADVNRREKRSSIGNGLETFPVRSSLSPCGCMHARTAAFYPAAEKYHVKSGLSSSGSHISQRAQGLLVREVCRCVLNFAAKAKWCRCAWFVCSVSFCPTLRVSSRALLQPDPECCVCL